MSYWKVDVSIQVSSKLTIVLHGTRPETDVHEKLNHIDFSHWSAKTNGIEIYRSGEALMGVENTFPECYKTAMSLATKYFPIFFV